MTRSHDHDLLPLIIVGVRYELADFVIVNCGLGREVFLERAVEEVHSSCCRLA